MDAILSRQPDSTREGWLVFPKFALNLLPDLGLSTIGRVLQTKTIECQCREEES